MMASMTLKNVSKIYPGGSRGVDHLNIDIADGEFIVLVGPSGCGKSTTMRLIAGLEEVSSGELFIDGKDVTKIEPGKRDLAMVFQSYALYPHMSVRNNMAYGLKNQRMPKAQINERIAEAAKILKLEEFLDRLPAHLSGGQRQRVAMGRALVRKPKAFLLDEPLSNLDTKLRTHMRAEIKSLHQRLATTFIYVTHDQVEAMSLADRIVVMNEGRVEQIGTPDDIYDRPASKFVAEFIGAPPMNVLPGGLFGQHAPYAAFRPEHGVISHGHGHGLNGHLELVEHLGAESLLHVVLESGDTCIIKKERSAALPEINGAISIKVDGQHLIILDR